MVQVINESKQLKQVNDKLMREKIISESVGYLDKTKQDMVKNLVKDVPTEKLTESVKKYIPMILGNSSVKSINKNERVLKENKKPVFLTGNNKNKVAMDLMDTSSQDVDAEIAKIIANSKLI